ncbi:hypothetical protein BCR36DRAFT_369718 [Piromyces finnis]|uniref:Uncharacterized protein n=1 Tax=Piromyces finnis TaxID=1754191 RepID=A0A1Y1VCH6_9FUNG|nr:hypothetical protein BCR36DRAFT_369718 [Piromyces finnis]|eukprot:ORX51808.1 hypothetical protein BCR36DRAFT_369718 [Piromyces finnis]
MFAADEIESPSSKNRPPPCIAFLVDTSVTPLYLDNQKVFGTCTVETLTITDIHSNIYIKGKIEKYTNQYYVDKKFQWGYQFYTSDSRTLLLSSNKNKFFKLNQDSINMFVENFKKLLFKNIQEKYLKSKSSSSNTSTSSFNCLNNLVITLRECLASFNWNYSRDVGFLSPIKKKKKSVILHHFLFLMTPLPDSYFALVKYVENQNVYHDLLQKHNSIEEEEEEEEDPSALKEKMDLLLDKFQNEFIKKALWTAYLQNKIGISWIDTNPRYEEDKIIDLEIWSKMQYIEEKYIKESIETLLSVYGGSIINLYDISQESSLLPFSSYISNYRTKAINMAIGELLINQGKDRREKMILENEEKKMKNILWSGSLTHTKGKILYDKSSTRIIELGKVKQIFVK